MIRIPIKVVTRASRERVVGWVGERLKVAVCAAPEKGKANAAVEDLLARRLGVPRAAVRLVAGHAAPLKTVEIDGDEEALRRILRAP